MKRRLTAALAAFVLGVTAASYLAFGLYFRFQAQDEVKRELLGLVSVAAQRPAGDLPSGAPGDIWFRGDPDGRVLQSSAPEITQAGAGEDLTELLQTGEGSAVLTQAGNPFVGAAVTLSDGGRLAVIRSFSLLRSSPPAFWSGMLAAAALVLLGGLLAAYVLSEILARPMLEMTRTTARIAAGELPLRIRTTGLGDLTGLAAQINAMADRLENTLTQSLDRQNQMEAILGSMNSGVIAVDLSGQILIFNTFARRIFGVYGEAMGRDIREVLKETDVEELLGVSDSFKELTLARNAGVTVRFKTTELITDGNRPRGKVTVIQDVTDLKKLEQMRSQFVANVSHELKTPLTSIKGFAETLRVVEDPATRNKFLDIIDAESERLRRLIEDILSLSAIENQERKPNNLINASEETISAIRLLEMQAKDKNISLSLLIKGEPEFLGEADMYRQMLLNLIENAIKYTDRNGWIKVRLEEEQGEIILSVQDSGIGIPKEHLPRLFERFYRVDKSRDRAKGGTGLGLAIVKHIVLAFGGTITVHSASGEGSTFTVKLPPHRQGRSGPGNKIQTYKFSG